MLRLSLIGEEYGCVAPLFSGAVRLQGGEIEATRSPSPQAMRRQLTGWEFDVCEMAFGAYLIARAQGADVTAIPVFPRRAFFHIQFACRSESGIEKPADLAGKRVGVAEYVQSATVWARGVLERDFALDARRVHWYVERAGADSTGAVLGYRPPAALDVRQTPGGQPVAAMLQAGELDAALAGALVDAAGGASAPASVRPLFPDTGAEARRFYAQHGYVPANHCYMLRGSLVREHPSLAADLVRAFAEAKSAAEAALPAGASPAALFGNAGFVRVASSLPLRAFDYGIAANRTMLETVIELCHTQGLTADKPSVESLFAPGTA
jgi:4,5-dihydroxyphthalate decarboxylase